MHTFTSAHATPRAHGGLLRHVASWAALASPGPGRPPAFSTRAALLGASWQTCRATHQRRITQRPSAKPEREQVWEDEGGQSQMPKSPPP